MKLHTRILSIALAALMLCSLAFVGCNGTGTLPAPTETVALPWIALALAAALAFRAPNTWQLSLRPTWRLATALGTLFVLCVATILVNSSSPFLYFQF